MPLTVLLLEDDDADAELVRKELGRAEPPAEVRRVKTLEGLEGELAARRPDAVLADYRLRGFTALSALERVRRLDPDLPFILVTGALGEEEAAEIVRRGATDCVPKTRLSALPEALSRALGRAGEQRAAREALERSHQIFQSASIGIAVYDRSLRYVAWNPFMEAMTGRPAAEVVGRHSLDVFPALRDAGVHLLLDRALRGEDVQADDLAIPDPKSTGGVRWTAPRFGPLRDPRGEIVGVIGMVRDVTDRRVAEEKVVRALEKERAARGEVEAGEERFREIAENIRGVFWVATPDLSRTLYLSPAFEEVFGRRREQVYRDPLTWAEAIHPEDRARALETVKRLAPEGAYEQVYRTLHEDGTVRWVRDRAFPVRDPEGRLLRIVGLAEDITELKRVEEDLRALNETLEERVRRRTEALRESERSLDSILNSLLTFTVLLTPDGKILHVNQAPLRASGLKPSEVLGRHFWDFPAWNYTEESAATIRDVVARAAAGETVTGEFPVLIAPGRIIHMAAAFQPIRDPGGRVVRVLGEGVDVTERHRAKEALEASERKFRSLVSTIPGVVYRCETRPPWRMHFISEAVLDLTGYPPSEFMEGGRTWVSIMVPEDLPLVTAVAEESERAGKPGLVEYRIRRADGTIRWVLESGQFVKPSPDGEAYVEGVILDITSHKRMEEAYRRSEEDRLRLEEVARQRSRFEGIIGKSAPIQEVYRRLRLAGQSDVTVLLTGESGTGKELAAAAIHALSVRKEKPFVAVNCSAIPEALLESELFGHVKGAFTGAVRDKVGLFQAADGGTLFLDEVGDMPAALQVKVLRALQEREIRRVGDEKAFRVNVRIVAATNRDLAAQLSKGTMREDFYYRIRVFEIAMPPLRERKDDIPLLAGHFLEELAKVHRGKVRGFAAGAMKALLDHSWPGNVRELRNAVEHALVTASGDRIRVEDLPRELREGPAPAPGRPEKVEEERRKIVETLRRCHGNRTEAARLLGVSRVTLWKRIRRHGIQESDV